MSVEYMLQSKYGKWVETLTGLDVTSICRGEGRKTLGGKLGYGGIIKGCALSLRGDVFRQTLQEKNRTLQEEVRPEPLEGPRHPITQSSRLLYITPI